MVAMHYQLSFMISKLYFPTTLCAPVPLLQGKFIQYWTTGMTHELAIQAPSDCTMVSFRLI